MKTYCYLGAENERSLSAGLALVRGDAYTFGGGKGSRAGSGLSFASMLLSVRTRGENG